MLERFMSIQETILEQLRQLTEVFRKPENCVTFLSPKGVKRTVSRDLLKTFGFCKMFWIAKTACDIVN